MVFGLRVSLIKSQFFGINLKVDFIQTASSFLSCKIGIIPFKKIGIMARANHRRLSAWNHILDKLKRRLSLWHGKLMSLGGRVMMLSTGLSNIPIFYLSLFKAPKGITQKIMYIQRNFLWGVDSRSRKVWWVSWDNVCKSRKLGGFSVKSIGSA